MKEILSPTKECPFPLAILIFIILISVLGLNVAFFGDLASDGPNQIALILMSALVLFLGKIFLKISYAEIEPEIFKSVYSAIPACLILFMIGPLISLWIVGGIVPGLIYYGLELIHPSFFLPISFICCCIVSLSIGSSWSTMGTVGIALMGIGQVLGIPVGMSAGAVISGSYFGDKMSPLSDTTNMASAVCGVDLFTHIRYMLLTTVPAALISLILFSILGLTQSFDQSLSAGNIASMQSKLFEAFHISPLILIPPAMVLALMAKKVAPLPAIFFGCVAGLISALLLQKGLIIEMGQRMGHTSLYATFMTIASSGPDFNLGQTELNSLLNRGGMKSMLTTVWFILVAMFFGGVLETTGVVASLTKQLLKFAKGTGSLVGSTIGVCVIANMTTCEQYLAILLPGRMFKKSFEDQGLAPENLSRTLEDGGTMTAVLIPWNTAGVYATGVLGISPVLYAPYCFLNILTPIVSVFMASMNYKIRELKTEMKN